MSARLGLPHSAKAAALSTSMASSETSIIAPGWALMAVSMTRCLELTVESPEERHVIDHVVEKAEAEDSVECFAESG